MSRFGSDCRIYVGNLPRDIREREIEDLFYKYGRIADIAIKGSNGPAFAFVQFEDPYDASDAIRGRDGYDFGGSRLRVERSNSGRGGPGGREGGRSFSGRRSEFRIIVTGLPQTGSWQDLKDFCREAGDVLYSDVREGEGTVEFSREDDMLWAVKNLDGRKFKSHLDDTTTVSIRVDKQDDGQGHGRDRSRSPPRERSRSPPRARSRSPPRERSRSPPRDAGPEDGGDRQEGTDDRGRD